MERNDMKLRVLIADQMTFVYDSIRTVLAQEEDIYIIGCASQVEQLHFLMPQCNVALIGYNFAGKQTAGLIHELHDTYEQVKLIVVGVPEVPVEIVRFVESGVVGYILENDSTKDLLCKFRAAVENRALVSDEVAAIMMKHINKLVTSPPGLNGNSKKKEKITLLTPRQREVIKLICEGLTNEEIAGELCVECGTVKNHVHHILKKIGATNRHEAAAIYQMYFRDDGYPVEYRGIGSRVQENNRPVTKHFDFA
jgi:DNA-binding NarL/FixJ family response regulator